MDSPRQASLEKVNRPREKSCRLSVTVYEIVKLWMDRGLPDPGGGMIQVGRLGREKAEVGRVGPHSFRLENNRLGSFVKGD